MNAQDRDDRWQLPDGLDEVLPPDGERYEALRQALLQLYGTWGYEIVVPPLVEYIESLLTGLGSALDLQTFKLTDLETGRTLGVRADMTPQVARIDAHQLKRAGPTRLCYVGTVLRTRPEGLVRTRSPVQVGAELYGHGGIAADVEVVSLMLESLACAEVPHVHLDLGNAAVFSALAHQTGLDDVLGRRVFEALQLKARGEVIALLDDAGLGATSGAEMLASLADLNGDLSVLDEARCALARGGAPVQCALDELVALADGLAARQNVPSVHIDLAELRGYGYHPGIVFAAFASGHGQEVARGGRYDNIGAAFGRARPATGFSADLRTLMAVGLRPHRIASRILAPHTVNRALQAKVTELRAAGQSVVEGLCEAHDDPGALGCDRLLVERSGVWQVVDAPPGRVRPL
jgi:ATP phosphoribosyltransferase regulatory subunit